MTVLSLAMLPTLCFSCALKVSLLLLSHFKFVFWGLLALVVIAFSARAETPPSRAILVVEIENAGIYKMHYYVPVGSAGEDVPGVAHFVEHARFKHEGGTYVAAFTAFPGAQFNAITTHRFTRYELAGGGDAMPAALDFLKALHEPLKLAPSDMEAERKIVIQEIAQRTKGNPDTPFFLAFNERLMSGTPLAKWPGGTPEDIGNVTLQQVTAFADRNYPQANSFLLLLGPPLKDGAFDELKERFPGASIARIRVSDTRKVTADDEALRTYPGLLPRQREVALAKESFTVEQPSQRSNVDIFIHTRLIAAETSERWRLAAHILDNAIESRLTEGLHNLLAEDNALMRDVSVSLSPIHEGLWSFTVDGPLAPGASPQKVRTVVEDYLKTLSARGISERSFTRLKNRFFLRDPWEDPARRAEALAADIVENGYNVAWNWREKLRALSAQDVNSLAAILAQSGRIGEAHLKAKAN